MPRSFLAWTLLAALPWLPAGPAKAQTNEEVAPQEAGSEGAATKETAGQDVATEEIATEEVTERYDNGRVKVRRHVIKDSQRNYLNHGPWKMFDPDGKLVATGHYKLGKREGAWSRLQTKAAQASDPLFKGFALPFVWDAVYRDDLLEGKWTMFDAEGRQIRTWEFRQGRLEGKSVDWHPSGKKRRDLHFAKGIPQAKLREWDAAGKLIGEIDYGEGRATRSFVEKYPTGEKKLEGWHVGKKETLNVTLDWTDGTIHVQRVEGEGRETRHGRWTGWHRSGAKRYEGEYQHDQPVGAHTWWYDNGQRQRIGHFVNGRETGRWTCWHDNGVRSLEGEYLEGKREGRWTAWHQNGQKSQTGCYVAGKQAGPWGEWDEAGKLIEWRDFGGDPPQERPQLAQPATNPEPVQTPPLGTKRSDVPELLQQWRDRNSGEKR